MSILASDVTPQTRVLAITRRDGSLSNGFAAARPWSGERPARVPRRRRKPRELRAHVACGDRTTGQEAAREPLNKSRAGARAVMRVPEVEQRLTELGMPPAPTSREEFDQFMRAEIARWAQVIKDAKLPKQ